MNVVTKASMCLKAILLAPSKLMVFDVLADEDVPIIRAYSSILPSNMYAKASAAMNRAIFEAEDEHK